MPSPRAQATHRSAPTSFARRPPECHRPSRPRCMLKLPSLAAPGNSTMATAAGRCAATRLCSCSRSQWRWHPATGHWVLPLAAAAATAAARLPEPGTLHGGRSSRRA